MHTFEIIKLVSNFENEGNNVLLSPVPSGIVRSGIHSQPIMLKSEPSDLESRWKNTLHHLEGVTF